MIDFEMPEPIAQARYLTQTVAENMMRPVSRYFDENEHEIPWDYINFMHSAMSSMGGATMAPKEEEKAEKKEPEKIEETEEKENYLLKQLERIP